VVGAGRPEVHAIDVAMVDEPVGQRELVGAQRDAVAGFERDARR
jgi:hypothetical protein